MTKKRNIPHAHDRLFHYAMSDKRVHEEFLKRYLPTDIQALIDFKKVEQAPTVFISRQLEKSESDVVFKIGLLDGFSHLYVLVEHMSTVDVSMPLRLLEYQVNIFRQHAKEYQSKLLPLVHCIVFYTGFRPYTAPLGIFDLFGEYKLKAEKMMLKPAQLIDVSRIADEKFKPNIWFGTVEFVFKHVAQKTIVEGLKSLRGNFDQLVKEEGSSLITALLKYVLSEAELDENKTVTDFIESLTRKVKEESMTIAEHFIEQGVQKGMQQGIREGVKKIAHRLLLGGADKQRVAELTDLTLEELEAI